MNSECFLVGLLGVVCGVVALRLIQWMTATLVPSAVGASAMADLRARLGRGDPEDGIILRRDLVAALVADCDRGASR